MSQNEIPVVVAGVSKVLCPGAQRLDPMAREYEAIVTTLSDKGQLVTCPALKDNNRCSWPNRGQVACVHFRYRS